MPDNLTTTTEVAPAVGVFYDRVLLLRAKPKLVHGKFGQSRPIPANAGTVIKWRRYASLATATTQLSEGVTPPGKKLSATDMTAQVAQYGDFVHITDVVDLTVEDRVLTEANDLLGQQMGETLDELTRDILVSCASVTTASQGTGTATLLNKLDIDKVVKTMLNNDAEFMTAQIKAGGGQGTSPIRPSFWGIMHTNLIDDLENVSGFKSTSNYPAQQAVDEAEWGSTNNVRWLVSTKAHQPASTDSPAYYKLPIIGKNAYGIVNLERGNAKSIVKAFGSGGTSDPLNQRATAGWKAWYTARILNDSWMHLLKVTHS